MTTSQPNYRPDIDGLRAVAVLAVVLHHLSAPLMPGGYVGVDVFFVISGYLITRIISREMEEGTFTFARFYERRARRIFPALFAVLAVTLLAGYFLLLPSDYAATLRGALGTLFFGSNVVFWRDMAAGYFAATDAGLNPLLHTWSLAVEEQFYVFFPVLLLLCCRYFRRHIVLVLVACAVVSLAGAALLVQSKSVAVFFLSPFRAWELLAGSLLAFQAVPAIRSRAVRELTAGAGLLAILAACLVYDGKTTFPGLAALAPVLGAAAIIHAGSGGSSLVTRLLQWRPMVHVGLISYSLYLWHWPLIVLVRYVLGMEPLDAPALAALFVASLVLAQLSYRFVEQPFRRGQNLTRCGVLASSAVCVSLLGTLSGVALARDGAADRFSPEVVRLDRARSPDIPFQHCGDRPAQDWCMLGMKSKPATALLWGDSHLLAWAPALDVSLAASGVAAALTYSSNCPPLLDIENAIKAECSSQNRAVVQYLLAHPEVSTVIMSAYWNKYFREGGPLFTKNPSAPPGKDMAVPQHALDSTVQWLKGHQREVVLIGPVPVYEVSVPMGLALELDRGHRFAHTSVDDQRRLNAPFYDAVKAVAAKDHNFRFLEPIQWFCDPGCAVTVDDTPLYRDSNHLSVAGALALQPKLAAALPLHEGGAKVRISAPHEHLFVAHDRARGER